MTGRADPPDPEGPPTGGGEDDEFRSTVFDESFVRAARLREFSASERLGRHENQVGDPPGDASGDEGRAALPPTGAGGRPGRRFSGQFVVLLLVILLAFGAAIYLGARSPYGQPPTAAPQIPMRATLVPLVPRGTVPGGEPDRLLGASPARDFRAGAPAVELPAAHGTEHFSVGQVQAALNTAQRYVVASALTPRVLSGEDVRPVRRLLNPGQYAQFDQSLRAATDDGRHTATGWLVRFDPEEAQLADQRVRVRGDFAVAEAGSGALEVTASHVVVYALRPTGEARADASLFTVRRELRMRFSPEELRTGRLTLLQADVQAGPLPCAEDTHDWLRPLLAGEDVGADGSAGTDPYSRDDTRTALCGVLARTAQPDLG
ncbi:hypothetical protein H3146_19410 [Streptomyces sp. OF3]|uniref:Uncharacterized protein n=1 Tax=Streptomyces alkaliterrae TaxID=2213162 RepID=A0A7W3ZPD2_9ACTN|nr:hypothetical protein [Streptomyces alkaliterrae]MBB1255505.1 hypothetical protein [Streptomyces alkaliterrae]